MATKSIKEACKYFTRCITTTQGKMYLELLPKTKQKCAMVSEPKVWGAIGLDFNFAIATTYVMANHDIKLVASKATCKGFVQILLVQ